MQWDADLYYKPDTSFFCWIKFSLLPASSSSSPSSQNAQFKMLKEISSYDGTGLEVVLTNGGTAIERSLLEAFANRWRVWKATPQDGS